MLNFWPHVQIFARKCVGGNNDYVKGLKSNVIQTKNSFDVFLLLANITKPFPDEGVDDCDGRSLLHGQLKNYFKEMLKHQSLLCWSRG